MEVIGNELFERDAETNATVRVVVAGEGGEKVVKGNELYVRDVETNALVPVVKVLGGDSGSGGGAGGGAGQIDYSTEEQDTGVKWIDGKTVYVKTYYRTSISIGSGTAVFSLAIPEMDNIISINAIGKRASDSYWCSMEGPSLSGGFSSGGASFYVSESYIWGYGNSYVWSKLIVTLKYTKK